MEDIYFSKSRYSLMKECLGKYFFKYIKKESVKEILWPGTLYGTSIHLYIEKHLKEIKKEKDIKALPLFRHLFFEQKKYELDKNKNLEYKTPRGFTESFFLDSADSWSKKIVLFLFKYLPKGEILLEEKWRESVPLKEKNIVITGILDLQVRTEDNNYIFDFKNTKNPSTYYFVDWNKDVQSLSYLYLLRSKSSTFQYLVLDIEESFIFVQSRSTYQQIDEERFFNILNDFHDLHSQSENRDLWSPSESACKWCDFKGICEKKYSEK